MRGGGRGYVGGKKYYVGVRTKLFWRPIYCAKPRTNPGSQSGSRPRRVLVRQAPWIMQEYELTTVIVIHLLTHPQTCDRGSSSFSAMSQIKFVRTTRASFPIMSYTERENRDFFVLFVEILTMLIFIFLLPTIQEIVYWILPVGVRVRVSKSDVNYSVSLDPP